MKDICRSIPDTPAHQLMDQCMMVNRHLRYVMERKLSKTGVYRSQHQILMHLARHPKASQKDIARFHGVSTATVAVTLKKLEKGGYIQKIVDEKDNRFHQVCLTEKGEKVVADSFQIFHQMEECMFHGFSEEDYQVMGELFNRIYQNLQKELPARTEREDL